MLENETIKTKYNSLKLVQTFTNFSYVYKDRKIINFSFYLRKYCFSN